MNIFIDLKDILAVSLIIIFAIIYIIITIINALFNIGKKNCYYCKYYELDDVAGCGDCCWYRCTKHNRKDGGTSMNTREYLERCKDFINI